MKDLVNILRGLDRIKGGEADNLNTETLEFVRDSLKGALDTVQSEIELRESKILNPS